jgi:tryptophan synthase alpha chain
MIASRTSGFLYLVSLTGVTGARPELPPGLEAFIARARQVAKTPIAVGFGISTPQQAASVGRLADGVIVGSAFIRSASTSGDPARETAAFAASLLDGLHQHAG